MNLRFASLATCLLSLWIAGCGMQGSSSRTQIDQVPMYGGMDRQAVPVLRDADAKLIADATSAFGSRRKASEAWADQGFRYYANHSSEMAMKRFNQAWLLDSKNPESYWGFGLILRDRGDVESGRRMMERAHKLGLRERRFLDAYAAIRQ